MSKIRIITGFIVLGLLSAVAAGALPAYAGASESMKVAESQEPAGKASIRLLKESRAAGRMICLGDIADIETSDEKYRSMLREIVVGTAAEPGFSRSLHASYVKSRVRQQGVQIENIVWGGSQQIVVETKTFRFSPDDFQSHAEKFIREVRKDADGKIHIRPVNEIRPAALPQGKMAVKTELLSPPSRSGHVAIRFTISVDGHECEKRVIPFVLEVLEEVLVAARTVDRHEIIKADDLMKAVSNVGGLPSFYKESGDLTGKRARKTIIGGNVITQDMVELPPVIKCGDLVIVVIVCSSFRITAQGRALEDAALGESMRVVNTSSMKEITARVVNERLVKVECMGSD